MCGRSETSRTREYHRNSGDASSAFASTVSYSQVAFALRHRWRRSYRVAEIVQYVTTCGLPSESTAAKTPPGKHSKAHVPFFRTPYSSQRDPIGLTPVVMRGTSSAPITNSPHPPPKAVDTTCSLSHPDDVRVANRSSPGGQ